MKKNKFNKHTVSRIIVGFLAFITIAMVLAILTV